jgi:hypothetical protein
LDFSLGALISALLCGPLALPAELYTPHLTTQLYDKSPQNHAVYHIKLRIYAIFGTNNLLSHRRIFYTSNLYKSIAQKLLAKG